MLIAAKRYRPVLDTDRPDRTQKVAGFESGYLHHRSEGRTGPVPQGAGPSAFPGRAGRVGRLIEAVGWPAGCAFNPAVASQSSSCDGARGLPATPMRSSSGNGPRKRTKYGATRAARKATGYSPPPCPVARYTTAVTCEGALSGPQRLPARDQRAEDLFGERWPKAHESTELGLRNHEYPARLADTGGQEAALAGQQGQLANERSRAKCDEDDLIVAIGPHDLGFTLEDDEQVIGRLSSLEEELASRHRLLSPERGHFRELGRAQHGRCEGV